jgi:uncharacterized protein (DUF1330 family)
MSAYVVTIVDVRVENNSDLEEYRAKVQALVRKHGGEYLVRGGNLIVLEGGWHPTRLVILRFPDLAAVENLFSDPEYEPLKTLRDQVAECDIVAVEGM